MTAYLPSPFDAPFDLNSAALLGFNSPAAHLSFQAAQASLQQPPPPPPGPPSAGGQIFYISHSPTVSTPSISLSHTGIPLKRGPDELGILPNGNGHTFMEADESKKVRLENVAESPPSKVVHIRNVPSDSSEQDVALLGVPFGPMTSMVVSKKVNQALLEMSTLDMSLAMVAYYLAHPPTIRGRTVIVQFSRHQRLETKQSNAAVDAALHATNQLVHAHQAAPTDGSEPRTVLRVIVENTMGHMVNYLVIYKICQRFGRLLRIIVFTRNGQFQCLVEFESSVAAHVAKLNLNGQNIYSGCCTLRVDFSKLSALEVRTESDKCRDLVRSPLTDAERAALNALPLTASANQQPGQTSPLSLPHPASISAAVANAAALGMYDCHQLSSLPQLSPGQSLQFSHALQAANFLPLPSHLSAGLPPLTSPLGPTLVSSSPTGLNTVLLISNLNEEKVSPDALFTLFGVYGDVIRVKVMFNKKDNALIQFADPQHSQTALDNLNGVRIWDQPMKIAFSRHTQVQLPKEGSDAGLTKDYSETNLHRFKKPQSKNYQNIYPPSATLHLSNIPGTTTESDIRGLFDAKGYSLLSFRFMMKEKKMALAQLDSVDTAILALIDLHNTQLSENYHLRVSFSKAQL